MYTQYVYTIIHVYIDIHVCLSGSCAGDSPRQTGSLSEAWLERLGRIFKLPLRILKKPSIFHLRLRMSLRRLIPFDSLSHPRQVDAGAEPRVPATSFPSKGHLLSRVRASEIRLNSIIYSYSTGISTSKRSLEEGGRRPVASRSAAFFPPRLRARARACGWRQARFRRAVRPESPAVYMYIKLS